MSTSSIQVMIKDYLTNLSNQLQKSNKLEEVCGKLRDKHNLEITIGAELEFYLHGCTDLKSLKGFGLKKEEGNNQFEIELPPSSDISGYAQTINDTRNKIQAAAKDCGLHAHLSPKPFKDDYGNSMHIHVSFNKADKPLLDHAASSLCHFMLQTFLVFMPTEEDYLRVNKDYMAPTCVSYGENNRSVAIRIPTSAPKRLEHRVAGGLSDPYLTIFTIMKSILLGLEHRHLITKFPKIYGNAYDEQYNPLWFPSSLKEAAMQFNYGFFT